MQGRTRWVPSGNGTIASLVPATIAPVTRRSPRKAPAQDAGLAVQPKTPTKLVEKPVAPALESDLPITPGPFTAVPSTPAPICSLSPLTATPRFTHTPWTPIKLSVRPPTPIPSELPPNTPKENDWWEAVELRPNTPLLPALLDIPTTPSLVTLVPLKAFPPMLKPETPAPPGVSLRPDTPAPAGEMAILNTPKARPPAALESPLTPCPMPPPMPWIPSKSPTVLAPGLTCRTTPSGKCPVAMSSV